LRGVENIHAYRDRFEHGKDQSPPLSEREQEALLDEYWTTKPYKDPAWAPNKVVRTCMGVKHPAVKALVDEIKEGDDNGKVMKSTFSFYNHYAGILLLASEAFYHFMDTAKFDSGIYEDVVAALTSQAVSDQMDAELTQVRSGGGHVGDGGGGAKMEKSKVFNDKARTASKESPFALKAAFANDFLIVRQMMLEESGLAGVCATIQGYDAPDAPIGHTVEANLDHDHELSRMPFDTMIQTKWSLNPIDAKQQPKSTATTIMVNVDCQLTVTGLYSKLTITNHRYYQEFNDVEAQKKQNPNLERLDLEDPAYAHIRVMRDLSTLVNYHANMPQETNHGCKRTLEKNAYFKGTFTLKNDQTFLSILISFLEQPTLLENIYVAVTGATTATIRKLVTIANKLKAQVKKADRVKPDWGGHKSTMKAKLTALVTAAGMQVEEIPLA
jgi:hypothetical protein